MREIPIEELETPFRLTLEKAQKAIAGKYFHYARSLLMGLLEHYPNCPALRLMLRQTVLVIHERRPMPFAFIKTALVNIFYVIRLLPFKHINSLEWILTETPDCLYAHSSIANEALKKEMWGTAALSLETISTLNPTDSHSQVLLAKTYLKLGRIEEAQGIVKNVLERTPQNDFAEELLKQASVEQTLKNEVWRK